MKENNIFRKINNTSIDIILGGIIIVLTSVYFYSHINLAKMTPDSYYYADWTWSMGYTSRPPIYLILIEILQTIFQSSALYVVGIIQILIAFISYFYLYKTIILLTDNNKIALLMTMIYSVLPTVIAFNCQIMSESLAMSSTIFFIYYSVRFIKDYQSRNAILAVSWSFIATMIKSACCVYTYALLIMGILLLLLKWNDRKKATRLIIPVIVTVFFYMIWSLGMYNATGVFNLNMLTSRHNLATVIRDDLYRNYHDKNLVKQIDEIVAEHDGGYGWKVTTPVMALFGDDQKKQNINTAQFAKECIRNNYLKYIKGQIMALRETIDYNYEYIIELDTSPIAGTLIVIFNNLSKIIFSYIATALGVFVLIIRWIRLRTPSFELIGIVGGHIMIIFSTFLGTYSGFDRCLVCMVPFTVVFYAMFISLLNNSESGKSRIS